MTEQRQQGIDGVGAIDAMPARWLALVVTVGADSYNLDVDVDQQVAIEDAMSAYDGSGWTRDPHLTLRRVSGALLYLRASQIVLIEEASEATVRNEYRMAAFLDLWEKQERRSILPPGDA